MAYLIPEKVGHLSRYRAAAAIRRLEGRSSSFGEFQITTTPRVLTYSTSDVIDERISVPAQHSLVRLSRSPATGADAVGMLEAVKAGRLAGIYCVNWKKPAQRALKFGKSWWTVIPAGEDAILMADPDNPLAGPPLIAFRRGLDTRDKQGCGRLTNEQWIAPSPARLDKALLKAWSSYQLWRKSQQSGPPPIPTWVQPCLNRILRISLPLTSVLDFQTSRALRSFRQRSAVAATESEHKRFGPELDRATMQAVATACQQLPSTCQTEFQDAEGDLIKHNWLPFPDYKFNTLAFAGLSVLVAKGRGFRRLAADLIFGVKPHGQDSHGKLLFAKTSSSRIPSLWAVFVPHGLPLNEPIPVHVFFSPVPRPDMLPQDYPYSGAWKGHLDNYLVNKGKKLLQQHATSGKRCVFVFPAVRPGIIYGDLTKANNLRRYLMNLLCWLRGRLDPASSVKEPTLGRCAISAFSSGGPTAVYPIMGSSLRGEFPELAEAYCLDTFPLALSVIKTWWANGKRVVRIYRDFSDLPNIDVMFTQPPMAESAGAKEYQAKNATFIYTPQRFWDTVFMEDGCTPQNVANNFMSTSPHCQSYDYWNIIKGRTHQLMPCVFMQHALKNSGFPNI